MIADFSYRKNQIKIVGETLEVTPETHQYRFQTKLKPTKTGLLLVGIGGNNGSTVIGATIANRENLNWKTKLV